MADIFFVIGCARSGTTALVKMLNMSQNATVFVEQKPNLCIEARNLYRGILRDPKQVIQKAKSEPIQKVLSNGLKYGDKNLNYLPFVPYIAELWDCRFLFPVRDGREVVRSLMDWHDFYSQKFSHSGVFAMKEDDPNSSVDSPEQDWWDYSRLRPNPGTPYFETWQRLSRFEKCAWYWANFNKKALELFSQLDNQHWLQVDMKSLDRPKMRQVFDFLGLDGFNAQRIGEMINARINSLQERAGLPDKFPPWTDWTQEQRNAFDRIAGEMMECVVY